MANLRRRDFDLGAVPEAVQLAMPDAEAIKQAWLNDESIVLPSLLASDIEKHAQNINNAHSLMENVLKSGEITPFIETEPYITSYSKEFSIVATSAEEHDEQGIEKIYFDAFNGEEDNVVAEELWCKGSWLSFIDGDASLRFRFSWGMEGFEDVAADPIKQHRDVSSQSQDL